MDTYGQHLLAEFHHCRGSILNDLVQVEQLMNQAAKVAGATVVASVFHPFQPQGVSGVVVIEESHLSIHTWPETGYAAVDFYTCGDCVPRRAYEFLQRRFECKRAELLTVERGLQGAASSLRVGVQETSTAIPQVARQLMHPAAAAIEPAAQRVAS
ncbi:MAG: adenosylmethionine decarboxylase [Polyangiales bacterium]